MNTVTNPDSEVKFTSIKDRLEAQLARAEQALREVEALGMELQQYDKRK